MNKKNGIHNPPRQERLIVRNGKTNDIIKVVMEAANDDHLTAQVEEFAQRFKGTDAKDQVRQLRELWSYTRMKITYEEDPEGKQYIKDPGRVYWDNKTGDGSDCKSLSLFEYFVCRAIGVPCYFEFVSYFEWWEGEGKRITHVYPVAVVPGHGEVVIDAVYTRFNQRAPGATRVVKKYTKVFSKMADIYRVSGLKGAKPSREDLANELSDRAKLVKPSAFVDYPRMSAGEMETFLLAQRDKILSEFYQGTPQGQYYKQAFELKRDALWRGLHRGFNLFGAKSKTQAASGWLTSRERGLDLSKGFNALFDDAPDGAQRACSVGAIPQLNCEVLYPIPTFQAWKAQTGQNNYDAYDQYVNGQEAKRVKCDTENKWRDSLNKYWESGSLTLVYRAIPNAGYFTGVDPNAAALVGAKKGNHIETFTKIREASRISTANLNTWWENGNLANTIAYGLGPQYGIQFVDGLKANRDVAINGFIAALTSVAVDCLRHTFNQFGSFIGVIKGDLSLKQALQQHVDNIEDFFKKHAGDIEMLAKPKDFKTPGTPDVDAPPITCTTDADCPPGWHCEGGICVPNAIIPSNNNNNMLLIGAAVVGAGLLLSNKK